MKLSRLLISSAALVALSLPAFAGDAMQGPLYGKISGGAIMPETMKDSGTGAKLSFDTGWTIGGTLGYRVNDWFSVEGELSYLEADMNKASVGAVKVGVDGNVHSVLGLVNVNLYPMRGAFEPYVGLGVGAADSKAKIKSIGGIPVGASASGTDLALQGSLGFNYAVGANTSIGAQYRYLWTDTGGGGVSDFKTHSLTASVTFGF